MTQTGYKVLEAACEFKALTAEVRYEKPEKPGRVQCVSVITIKHGGEVLGTAKIGGKFSQVQALKEFTKTPKRFGFEGTLPKSATKVTITIGPATVAEGVLDGEFTPELALAAFKTNPEKFATQDGFDTAKLLGLVA